MLLYTELSELGEAGFALWRKDARVNLVMYFANVSIWYPANNLVKGPDAFENYKEAEENHFTGNNQMEIDPNLGLDLAVSYRFFWIL